MKFDFCIGNPPYQGDNHQQLYPDFFQAAKDIAGCIEMIFPTGWQQPKNANNLAKMNTKEVKEDKQIVLIDNVHNVFPGVSGAEWTNVIIWKKGYNNGLDGKQLLLINGSNAVCKKLLYDKADIPLIPILQSVLQKVKNLNFKSIVQIIFIQNTLDLKVLYDDYPCVISVIGSNGKDKRFEKNSFEKLPIFHNKQQSDDDIVTLGVKNGKRAFMYVSSKYVDKNHANLYKYKLCVSCAASDDFGAKLSDFEILKPCQAFTRSFISFGAFDEIDSILNVSKYLKTKFARVLLYTLKTGRMNNRDTWKNVPLQDFTDKSDIDWSKSVHEIDLQLYRKYGLDEKEIAFIEEKVKAMD